MYLAVKRNVNQSPRRSFTTETGESSKSCNRKSHDVEGGTAAPIFYGSLTSYHQFECQDGDHRRKITDFELPTSFNEPGEAAGTKRFLEKTKDTLTMLKISNAKLCFLEDVFDSQMKFPQLKKLHVVSECANDVRCLPKDVIKSVLSYSKLEELTVDLKLSSFCCLCWRFLKELNLETVVKLRLKLIEFGQNYDFWHQFKKLKLNQLKVLEMKCNRIKNEVVQSAIFEVLRTTSSTITELNMGNENGIPYYGRKLHYKEPDYPKLKKFGVMPSHMIPYIFTTKRFPSLLSLEILVTDISQIKCCLYGRNSLMTIETLKLTIDRIGNKKQKEIDKYVTLKIQDDLSRIFPNVVNLEIIDRKEETLFTFNLPTILSKFKNLKILGIYARIDFLRFFGIRQTEGDNRFDSPYPDIIPTSPLEDKGLEELMIVSHKTHVSDETLTSCLSRVTKLKRLGFAWNAYLRVRTLEKSLQHFEQLEILKIHHDMNMNSESKNKLKKEFEKWFPESENWTISLLCV